MSDRQLRFRSAPGAQLLRLGLLGVFEVVVGLHEEKPRTLPIADRMSLLQAGLRLPSPQIDASHEPTPVARMCALQRAIVAKCRNMPLARRRKLRVATSGCPSGMRFGLLRPSVPKRGIVGPRCRADSAIGPLAPSLGEQSLRKIGFETGEFRPGLLRFAGTRSLAVRRCLYEIVYDVGRVVPCSCFARDACDFFPPFRGVFAAHHCPPDYASTAPRYMHNRGDIMYYLHAPIGERQRAWPRSRAPRSRRKSPDLRSA